MNDKRIEYIQKIDLIAKLSPEHPNDILNHIPTMCGNHMVWFKLDDLTYPYYQIAIMSKLKIQYEL